MNNAELMTAGRKQLSEVDSSLFRSERVINDTIAIGAQTAETLQVQGGQLAKVMDDLDEIHFTMKKARQVLRDMARGLATDRCIMVMLLLVIIGIVVIVVLKILKVDGVKI
jgi:novel plant SNARE